MGQKTGCYIPEQSTPCHGHSAMPHDERCKGSHQEDVYGHQIRAWWDDPSPPATGHPPQPATQMLYEGKVESLAD